jgi:type IV pilus assembly protein PilC
LKAHDDIFPELLINMVEVGEVSGTLDAIMDRMAVNFEKESRVQNKVKGAMVYPIVLSVVAVCVVAFLLAFVLPTFTGMFEQSNVPLPLPTKIILGASDGLLKYWYVILPVLGLFAYLAVRWAKTDDGRLQIDKFKLKIPVVRNVAQKVATARFTRTMAMLISSGFPLLQALEVVAKVVGNQVMSNGILKAREEVMKGIELSIPIRNMGLFPPMIDSLIKIGEESGSLDNVLEKTAEFYDGEVETATAQLTTMIEPMIIIVLGFVVGFIILSIILPMFQMYNSVGI